MIVANHLILFFLNENVYPCDSVFHIYVFTLAWDYMLLFSVWYTQMNQALTKFQKNRNFVMARASAFRQGITEVKCVLFPKIINMWNDDVKNTRYQKIRIITCEKYQTSGVLQLPQLITMTESPCCGAGQRNSGRELDSLTWGDKLESEERPKWLELSGQIMQRRQI